MSSVLRPYQSETFQKVSKYVEHQNSAPKWMFKGSPELLSHKEIEDLTESLAACQ
ncbi:hypothetical protein AALB_2737 [Agarivorans albus MKT 106]|uniref:Uncharacterized protein n=1 Tax=Agarivorans albus MKT 106 TaxID=1331007 RepID=R9PMP1_AGAAL|nr:hypothetical protein AALB_2737 [Agarivorans albus MKT 106]